MCTISSGHSCASTSATGSVEYEYDDADNRTRVDEDNGNAASDLYYCHDALGQLIGRGSTAACDTSNVETYTYDDAGNRTQAVTAGPVTTNFAYTASGLLCDTETGSAASCSGGNVGSDDAGRLADLAGWHYLYDAQGRLVSACDDADCVGTGFERVDFEYDGEGHRTAISVDDGTNPPLVTTFRYQGAAIAAEYLDGDLSREYVTDGTGTISKVVIPPGEAEDGTYLVTWNGHGDAMALYRMESNGSLTLANSFTYSTWGRPTTATHNGIADLGFRFLYVGAADVQWDAELGLHYMHARHYSPTLGRFLQPDPSRLDAQLFVYAGNGPVTRVDPSGTIAWFVVIFAIVRVATAAVPMVVRIAPAASKATSAIRTAVALGRAGEAAVRAAYNIGKVQRITVGGRIRYPDGLLPKVISEVKNVKYLTYSHQLRDYATYARLTGRKFHLYVRSDTQISQPLRDAVNRGEIILRYIP